MSRGRRFRALQRATLYTTTVLCAGLAAPAFAQTADAPEQYRNNDEHGVDLTTGTYNPVIVEGGIGDAEEGISLVRYHGQAGWKDNWSGDLRVTGNPGSQVATITFGNVSEKFTQSSSNWVNAKANGATLVKEVTSGGPFAPDQTRYVFTARDGSTVTYTNVETLLTSQTGVEPTSMTIAMASTYCNSSNAVDCALPTSIETPDGSNHTLTWDTPNQCETTFEPPTYEQVTTCNVAYRLIDVRSRSSYGMKVKYQSNSWPQGSPAPATSWTTRSGAKFFDLSEVYCSQTALNCDSVTAASSVSYSYSGGQTTITDDKGGQWVLTTSAGKVTGIRRPGASSDTTSISYGTNGRVSSITANGETKTYDWTTGTTTVVETSTSGGESSTVTSTPAAQQPVSVENGTNNTISFTYDANGRKIRETRPEGDYTHWTRDARGNVTETRHVAKPGSGLADIVATASFAATCSTPATCNKPAYTIDARGKRTDYTYATHGGITRVRYPAPSGSGARPEINYGYTALYPKVRNASGNLVNAAAPQYKVTQITACATAATCSGTVNETKVTLAYGTPNLLLTQMTVASGNGAISSTTAYTYDNADNLTSVDGPLPGAGDTTHYFYDAHNRRRGVIGPDPDGAGSRQRRAERYTFDVESRVTKIEIGNANAATEAALNAMAVTGVVEIAYDANGNAASRKLKSGSTTYSLTQFSYDSDNRLVCTAIRMNPAVYASLPASACSPGTAGSFGPDRITRNHYDASGRVFRVQSALGTADVADEFVATFTPNGRRATLTDGESNRTTYIYDGHDRLYQTRYPHPTTKNTSNTSDYEQLTYDAAGNVTARRLRDGQTIGYGYDALNRLISKNLPGSEPDATYGYDLMNRLTSAVQSGQTLTFAHDALGRNTSQSGPLGTVGYQYDAAGRRTRMTWPDGFYVTYEYHSDGSIKTIRENGSTVLASYGYNAQGEPTGVTFANGASQALAFDPVGRLSSIAANLAGTSADNTRSFTYNPAGQLTQITQSNDAYAFDGLYNVDRTYTVNGRNQLTSAGGVTLSYDTRGNLTNSGNDTFAYTSENLLTGVAGVASMVYDPLGRLWQVADLTSGGTTTRFGYDGIAMIGEYNTANQLQRRYIHGPGIDSPIVWYEGSGTANRRFLHADERGSIIAVSNASGALLGANAYDEYGIPGSDNLGRFQYTGQVWLEEAGLYYYKARMYSPTLGRFLQTDPIGYADGINLYNYVGGDPVNAIDPLGLACEFWKGHWEWVYSNGEVQKIPHSDFLLPVGCQGGLTDDPGGNPFGDGGLGGNRGDGPQNNCPVPSGDTNVYIEAVIVSPPAGPSYIQGTLTDPGTGATASFRQVGLGGITGVAGVRITGLVRGGFGALAGGFEIGGVAFTVGASGNGTSTGGGYGWASINNYAGDSIGNIDATILGATPGARIPGTPIGIGGAGFAYDFSPTPAKPNCGSN